MMDDDGSRTVPISHVVVVVVVENNDNKKTTARGVPKRSPIQVLTAPDVA